MTTEHDDDKLTAEQEARLAHLLACGVPLGDDGKIKAGGILDGMTPEEVMADREAYRRIVGE